MSDTSVISILCLYSVFMLLHFAVIDTHNMVKEIKYQRWRKLVCVSECLKECIQKPREKDKRRNYSIADNCT
ncbi:hypothetical protein WH47_00428 [Habropoda laboriosa]|uniref:Uncharacterized protein n=1 Tax=Habropoda laboriosa TaxID=597456 RepID=A0A0L7R785_9HYME|nr:hypothetical protein WH47_00428 [Habropoda laboriosa]